MASPSFVYAFDNLGPDKFVELCGLLLGARYKGFLLSSPGADGGVDAENDPIIGELRAEQNSLLINTVLPKNGVVIFQFKHKVVARVGEANARKQLLQHYKSSANSVSEVKKPNIIKLNPSTYVLVTNVEVNSNFRQTFIEQCRKENTNIQNYQVVGLDELESWVISERDLRALYFPTIFGSPRFNLKLKLVEGLTYSVQNPENLYSGRESACEPKDEILCLSVMNIGEGTSYLSSIKFKVLIEDKIKYSMRSPLPKGCDPLANPSIDEPALILVSATATNLPRIYRFQCQAPRACVGRNSEGGSAIPVAPPMADRPAGHPPYDSRYAPRDVWRDGRNEDQGR